MTNKVVLVTGGNSGIGRSIVHRFSARDYLVAIVGRNVDSGNKVEREVLNRGGTAAFFQADLSTEAAARDAVARIAEHFGRLDVVVNNAGLGSRRAGVKESDSPGERWARIRANNLDCAWYVSSHALPVLIGSGGGAIVNISSTAVMHGNWGTYCMAKAGVEAMTRAFAFEGGPHRIRVNCVSPGWIATDRDSRVPASGSADGSWQQPPSIFNRMGRPEEIADAVYYLASDQASFITGQTLVVDGGLSITDYTSMPLLSAMGDVLFSGKSRA